MYYECNGTRSFSEEEITRAIAFKAKENAPAPYPWPALSEHAIDAIVAKAINGSVAEARELPLLTFFEILVNAQAQAEAMPARLEHEKAEAERKSAERKQSHQR